MSNPDYYLSIDELSRHIHSQKISPVEVVHTVLDRIHALNPRLNAFITVLEKEALEQAQLAEREIKSGYWRGPLHGIPVGIKDFYDTAGIKTTAASDQFKDRVPKTDAIGVTRFKEAGAIIIGKMNMHQMGMGTTGLESAFGPAQNPWNAAYIPGGSSSGSAVAVTSGMCFATLDTDAIGSCRLPAACCGIVGFKGTYGLINAKGILEGTQPPDDMIVWFNHPGISTRTVADTALVLNALAEQKEGAAINYLTQLSANRQLSIAVADNFSADPTVSAAFEKALETISGFNHSISSAALPNFDQNRGLSHIETDRQTVTGKVFKNIDILLLPTLPTSVPTVKAAQGNPQALSPENTIFANYYGLPAISVPCGFDSIGLPLGVQIVGKPWDEAAVLQLAYQYQTVTQANAKHPIS